MRESLYWEDRCVNKKIYFISGNKKPTLNFSMGLAGNVPTGSREVLFMLLGVVIKEWGSAMQFWFGTTRSSQDKTRLMVK